MLYILYVKHHRIIYYTFKFPEHRIDTTNIFMLLSHVPSTFLKIYGILNECVNFQLYMFPPFSHYYNVVLLRHVLSGVYLHLTSFHLLVYILRNVSIFFLNQNKNNKLISQWESEFSIDTKKPRSIFIHTKLIFRFSPLSM